MVFVSPAFSAFWYLIIVSYTFFCSVAILLSVEYLNVPPDCSGELSFCAADDEAARALEPKRRDDAMTAVAIKCFIYSPSVLLGICGQHIALILCCCFNISGRRQPYRTTYWIRISKVTAKSILSQHRRPLFMPANMNRPHHARKTRSCSPEKTARTRQQIARQHLRSSLHKGSLAPASAISASAQE